MKKITIIFSAMLLVISLELRELREVIMQIEGNCEMKTLSPKEQSTFVAKLLQSAAARNGLDLKLRKKK